MKNIPFHKASIGHEEEKAILEVLRSGWLTKGPKTEEFEAKIREFIGVKYALGLNSCTAGLHLSLLSLGIGTGDEVITSPLTFAATANIIVHTGAKVVFADIDYNSGNISPNEIIKKITSRTRAIIVVHLAGAPCKLDLIKKICDRRRIALIEDAAHALGASYEKRNIGLWGKSTAFSFYATKNITTGEGGMLVTDSKRLYTMAQKLSLHGLSLDAWKRYMPKEKSCYSVDIAGYKYNMFDLQAALGVVQLRKYNNFLHKRNILWQRYNENLAGIDLLELPFNSENFIHAKHLYIIKIKEKYLSRDKLKQKLLDYGINTQLHFMSLHLQPFFKRKYNIKKNDFPFALKYSNNALSLPLYPKLEIADINYICNKIIKICKDSINRNG